MPNREHVTVEIRSNIEALSAARLHQSLVAMVRSIVEDSTAFMRSIEPKRTGALIEHTTHTDVDDLVGLIEARLGIKPVDEASSFHHGSSDSRDYPIFVDRGTGIFGETGSPIYSKHNGPMVFEEDGRTIFTRAVAGQEGQHFVAATEAFAEALLREDQHIRLALAEMAAEAAAMLPDTMR